MFDLSQHSLIVYIFISFSLSAFTESNRDDDDDDQIV